MNAALSGEIPLLRLGADHIIEVGHAQRQKDGERAAGDTIRLRRIPSEERAVVVLSDGLGSGVKANVLSALTATMAMEYSTSDIDPTRVGGIIMRTLPECSVRKVRYATFTAVNLRATGTCEIVNYDNPGPFLLDEHGCSPLTLEATAVPGALERRAYAHSGSVEVSLGQYVVMVSDGVTQSGMGTPAHPLGWGEKGFMAFLRETLQKEPHISARDLAQRVVQRAARNDGYHPRDDISCAVVYLRRPRRILIATGPPIDRQRDTEIADVVARFPGRTIVAGGTTANFIARELGRSVTVNLRERDPQIPPTSTIPGIDLVTEGTITMSRVAELLESSAGTALPRADAAGSSSAAMRKNGATAVAEALLEGDEIHFLVGTKINEAHQNPSVPVELEIRRNLLKRISRVLEEQHLKRTQIQFV